MISGKGERYFSNARHDLIALVPTGPHRVLELGAGEGSTCLALKEGGKASETVGIEINPVAAGKAEGKVDRMLVGNVETMDLPFPEGYFDYILCGDVLEHLIDPWRTLARLKTVLADSGLVIASIPNIQHKSIVKKLAFKGEWEYEQEGILDKTHLRFFTKKGIYQLFESSGYMVKEARAVYTKKEEEVFDRLTGHRFQGLLAFHYIVTASKGTGAPTS